MEVAQVVTSWAGDGLTLETANRPVVADSHAIKGYEDKTGIMPSGSYIVEVKAETTVMDAIDADPNFVILWREEVEDI